ncbi:MAG: fibronectin type III domain-containing protein [Thermodesulfobacteriota bacterium]
MKYRVRSSKKIVNLVSWFIFVLWIAALSACGGSGGGEGGGSSSLTLAWDKPETNADGTPLTDLAGYVVYYGFEPDFYFHQEKIIGKQEVSETSITIRNLYPGTYYFVVTAFDKYGYESEPATLYSDPHKNVLCVNIPAQGNPYECSQ